MSVFKRAFIFGAAFLVGGAVVTFTASFILVALGVPAANTSGIFGPIFLIAGFGAALFATRKWGW